MAEKPKIDRNYYGAGFRQRELMLYYVPEFGYIVPIVTFEHSLKKFIEVKKVKKFVEQPKT